MALSQQKFREVVFQLLYSADYSPVEEELLRFAMSQLEITKKEVCEAMAFKERIREQLETIDPLIEEVATEYTLERIPRVERNILRLSIFEMLHTELPPKVAISEALRLTRKFASPEGVAFVNAILDKIYNRPHVPQI